MMFPNMLKDRVTIQQKTTTMGPTGQTEVWSLLETRYARVIPLDAKARAVYQQLHSEVSHKVVFRAPVGISLGNNRIIWGAKTLEPVEPVQYIDHAAVVVVKEV